MNRILSSILIRLGIMKCYRVHNEQTGESFSVSGPSVKGCLHVARRECARLGWADGPRYEVCRSEKETNG